jgi:hypothetical protein
MIPHARVRQSFVAACMLLLAGCGGAAIIASAKGKSHATTPVAAGPLNLEALPLGDGYVSTEAKVGYVDSCITHFGGIGGSQVNGPWINTAAKTWNYKT